MTLTGEVSSADARRAAYEAAQNVLGVRGVSNELEIEARERLDDRAREAKVRLALTRDPWIDEEDVLVMVRKGQLFLTGDVDNDYQRLHAGWLATRWTNSDEVVNALTIRDHGGVWTDAELAQRVRDQFYWSPWVDEHEVEVTVMNDVVTLDGFVGSVTERRKAEDLAGQSGATRVINLLVVDRAPKPPQAPQGL